MPEVQRDSLLTELLKFVLPAVVIVLLLRFFVAQPFVVSGASMEPTFHNGQYLIIDELSYRLHAPERGDVVIFRYPKDPKQFFIKRIIGLPGETVYISNDAVSVKKVDGTVIELDESYVINRGNGASEEVGLASDEYFVMGDNRPESSDSRIWGKLPEKDLVGRAFLRLLPVNLLSLLPGSTQPQ